MANPELVKVLQQGSNVWNYWREQQPAILVDLRKAKLRNLALYGVDLHEAALIRADLHEANLSTADLRDANLSKTKLSNTNLRGADLRGTDLSGADLSGADLSDTNLDKTDLRGAIVWDTVFARMDLRTVKGLTQINHRGPSRITLHTIKLPQDGSALHFLRGAGVPDEWIDDYRVRMMNPIQYYSCFISYSSQDSILASRLHADLQAHGVRCWFAPEDMKIGDKIRARVDEAIHVHEKLLLLLSKNAIKSDWVEDEVEAAIEKEQRQQREVLFPIRLDNAVMETSQAWAAKLRRQRHIGNFTGWMEPQTYQQAFGRLLRNLKKADE